MKPTTNIARKLLAALALSLSMTAAAYAQAVQGLDGRWEGAIATPGGGKLTGVFNVATKAGKTTTSFDSPDQGVAGMAATVKREGDKVSFAVPMAQMTYEATLSKDGKTLTGNILQGGGTMALTMTQKPAGAAVSNAGPLVAGLDGTWKGMISTLNIAFRIKSDAKGTTTVLDSPDQGITGMLAKASRTGTTVTITVPGVGGGGGVYQATLSADGKTLDGTWSQAGQDMPATLKKQ